MCGQVCDRFVVGAIWASCGHPLCSQCTNDALLRQIATAHLVSLADSSYGITCPGKHQPLIDLTKRHLCFCCLNNLISVICNLWYSIKLWCSACKWSPLIEVADSSWVLRALPGSLSATFVKAASVFRLLQVLWQEMCPQLGGQAEVLQVLEPKSSWPANSILFTDSIPLASTIF